MPPLSPSLTPSCLYPCQTTTDQLSVTSEYFAFSRVLYKLDHICILEGSGSFTQHHYFRIHPCYCVFQEVFGFLKLFLSDILLYVYIMIQSFLHLLVDIKLFIVYYRQSYCDLLCINMYGHVFSFFLGEYLQQCG